MGSQVIEKLCPDRSMLRPRIIPCLLVQDGGLVKTIQFGNPKYVGDPLNAVRIFNEKQVDELMVVDIDATRQRREPDYALIRQLAVESRMPLCYGGGVHSADQVERIVSLGVEKVAISSAKVSNQNLLARAAERVGRQSIVAVLDVRKRGLFGRYEAMTINGTMPTGVDPAQAAKLAEEQGAGEIVVNNIDRDGMMKGYDLDLLAMVRAATSLPLTALGGAGTLSDISQLIERFGICGAPCSSIILERRTGTPWSYRLCRRVAISPRRPPHESHHSALGRGPNRALRSSGASLPTGSCARPYPRQPDIRWHRAHAAGIRQGFADRQGTAAA
jgi:imidazole glycerol-phosphate synthase subunit HisF